MELSKTLSKFADDSTAISHGQNLKVSEKAIEDSKEIITVWCPKWNIELSLEYTEVMVFPSPNTLTPKLKMNTNNRIVKQVQHKTVLSIIVDDNLDFIQHIQREKIKSLKL